MTISQSWVRYKPELKAYALGAMQATFFAFFGVLVLECVLQALQYRPIFLDPGDNLSSVEMLLMILANTIMLAILILCHRRLRRFAGSEKWWWYGFAVGTFANIVTFTLFGYLQYLETAVY